MGSLMYRAFPSPYVILRLSLKPRVVSQQPLVGASCGMSCITGEFRPTTNTTGHYWLWYNQRLLLLVLLSDSDSSI